MEISCKTDKGKIRNNNEDSFLVIPPWSKEAISKKTCLFLVADGMGGENAGELASRMAKNLTNEWFNKNKFDNLSIKNVDELINHINDSIWEYSQKHKETEGMGTTYSMIVIKDSKAIIGHIGDSRIYRLRNNEFSQLTNDHSIVGEQLRLGKITPEQAKVHPARGILSKVLGVRQFIKADVFETEIRQNDEFVLCTDGIFNMIGYDKIISLIQNTSPQNLSKSLVNEANELGGIDNSTVITLKINELPLHYPSVFSLSRFMNVISNFLLNNY